MCVREYVRACMRACVSVCECVCTCECVRECVSVSACVSVSVCVSGPWGDSPGLTQHMVFNSQCGDLSVHSMAQRHSG